MLLNLGNEGVEPANLDIPYFNLLLLVAFVLKYNIDEKNVRNTDVRIHVKLELQVGCWFNINEQLRYYCESANRDLFRPSTKKIDPGEKLDPRIKL